MVERGDGAGFTAEAVVELLQRDFDRDRTVQTGVAAPIDLAHRTLAERSEDLVGAEAGSGRQGHLA